MSTEACLNCGDPAGDTYDLIVRSEGHSEVPLCVQCHDALGQEFIWNE